MCVCVCVCLCVKLIDSVTKIRPVDDFLKQPPINLSYKLPPFQMFMKCSLSVKNTQNFSACSLQNAVSGKTKSFGAP